MSHDTSGGRCAMPATPRDFPCCAHLPPAGMPSPLPRRNHWVRLSFVLPSNGSLPRISGGSASALPFSRPAQRSLALRPACSPSPIRTLYTRSFTGFVTSTPFRLLPAGTTVAGWDSHPLRDGAFSRRTEISGLVVLMGVQTSTQSAVPTDGKMERTATSRSLKHRFTNLYRKEDGTWRLLVKQSTVIAVE